MKPPWLLYYHNMEISKEKSWLCRDMWKLVHLFEKKLGFTLEM